MDEYLPNVPDSMLLMAYGSATSDCQHELLFTVWDEPVAVYLCEGCGEVFSGDSNEMESELVQSFVEALEHV